MISCPRACVGSVQPSFPFLSSGSLALQGGLGTTRVFMFSGLQTYKTHNHPENNEYNFFCHPKLSFICFIIPININYFILISILGHCFYHHLPFFIRIILILSFCLKGGHHLLLFVLVTTDIACWGSCIFLMVTSAVWTCLHMVTFLLTFYGCSEGTNIFRCIEIFIEHQSSGSTGIWILLHPILCWSHFILSSFLDKSLWHLAAELFLEVVVTWSTDKCVQSKQ